MLRSSIALHSPNELLARKIFMVTPTPTPDYHHSQRPAMAEQYHRVMKRFELSDWFGIGVKVGEGEKRVPVHVNSRRNPRTSLRRGPDGTPLQGQPMRVNRGRRRDHLDGNPDKTLFHVSPGDRRRALIALDIDADAAGDWREAAAYGRAVLGSLFPSLETFDEPSRSWPRKGGAYGWLQVDWQTTPPELRQLIERLLNRHLRTVAAEIGPPPGIKMDGVRGLTSYEATNTHFDHGQAESDSLEQTRNLRPSYRRELEQTVRRFGTLITSPCFAAFNGERENNVSAFLEWVENKAGRIMATQIIHTLPAEYQAMIEKAKTSS